MSNFARVVRRVNSGAEIEFQQDGMGAVIPPHRWLRWLPSMCGGARRVELTPLELAQVKTLLSRARARSRGDARSQG